MKTAKLLLLLLLLLLPAVVQAEYFYKIDNGKITITGYNGSRFESGGPVKIPDTINGLPVTAIGGFGYHGKVTSVTIPASVTSIGSSAFSGSPMTSITIPDSVTSIGFGAFSGCHNLTNITIPKSVTDIGTVAFSLCVNLSTITVDPLNSNYSSVDGVLFNKSRTTLIKCPGGKAGSYTTPNGVTTIEDSAFSESTHLTGITIGNSVAKVEPHAFYSSTALTNVTIGSGVTDIGDDFVWLAFKQCPDLTGITVDARNPAYSSVDGVLFNKSQTTLLKSPEGKVGSYIIPNHVTQIGTHAFSGSTRLSSITTPDSVAIIEDNAFENCSSLTSVTMGNNVKSIGSSAFLSCTHLTGITIPDSVTNIADSAFYSCTSLTNVTIGKNVTSIGSGAFSSCSSLIAVTVDPLNSAYGSKNGVLFNKHQASLPAPTVLITDPANNAPLGVVCVDVHGTFKAKNLKRITVNEMPATIRGNTFEALNVMLMEPGTNRITAIAEDMAGNTGTNTISVLGPTNFNADVLTLPVQVQVAPPGGFAPLPVTFKVQAHVPGKIQKVFYDFDGDHVPDLTRTDLQSVTHTYNTAGQYFFIITVQTDVGRFSNPAGMLAMMTREGNRDSETWYVNVQAPPVLLSTIKINDPVAVKWTGTSNLYVLSGSTATVTEFDANGKPVRSKTGIGSNPSGLDVDAAGNIYVAMTGNNQVWKFKPTSDSFETDTSFGLGGFIGNNDGSAGSGSNQLNAPFDVVVSGNGQTITVSDSGNQRIQQFAMNGALAHSSSVEGGLQNQLKSPKGLAQDEIGIYLFVVDSGNSRIILTDNFMPMGSSGTNGSALGQFNGAMQLAASKRSLYVADTGNNRVQVFSHVESGEGHSPTPFNPRVALSSEMGLNHPKAVAAVNDFLEEKIYIADTGNNRVVLVRLPLDNPEAVWNDTRSCLKAGDIEGAISHFSMISKDYREAFLAMSKDELLSMAKDMKDIKPASIESDKAQYYFESIVEGKTLTFPVEFDKEFGQWKIVEY